MSTRPPPLRMSDRPPSYRVVTRVYNNSLRPIVIVIAAAVAIWGLIWSIQAFQDINDDKANGQPKFATFDLALGVIYAFTCGNDVFGIIAASIQNIALLHIYCYTSIAASLGCIGAGFLRVVTHFIYKDGLLSECEAVAQGQGVEFRFGIWGTKIREHLDKEDAITFCKNAYDRDSIQEIILLIFIILFSGFCLLLVFAYYHQVLDPTSSANVSRAPVNVNADPGYAYPDHYNPPYDAPGYVPSYAPPPGPPPAHASEIGYGVGMKDRDMKSDNDSEVTKFDDPFADFDEPSKGKLHDETR